LKPKIVKPILLSGLRITDSVIKVHSSGLLYMLQNGKMVSLRSNIIIFIVGKRYFIDIRCISNTHKITIECDGTFDIEGL
jgi:hypothetical protein